jgi:hypothetical protein
MNQPRFPNIMQKSRRDSSVGSHNEEGAHFVNDGKDIGYSDQAVAEYERDRRATTGLLHK